KAAAASSLSAATLGSGSSTAAALASGTLLGITKWGGAGVVSGVLFAVTAGGSRSCRRARRQPRRARSRPWRRAPRKPKSCPDDRRPPARRTRRQLPCLLHLPRLREPSREPPRRGRGSLRSSSSALERSP